MTKMDMDSVERHRTCSGKEAPTQLTEVFAGVMDTESGLDAAFVKWLIGRDVASVIVETQRMGDNGDRFDVWIDARGSAGERHLIVLENKILAAEGTNQLRRYEMYLAKQDDVNTRTLVYLTPHTRSDFRESTPVVEFREIYWYQVYAWLKEWSKRHDHHILVKELLRLMEDWSLALKLDANDLAVATAYQASVSSMLLQILDEIYSIVKSRLTDTATGRWSYEYQYLKYHSPWPVMDRH